MNELDGVSTEPIEIWDVKIRADTTELDERLKATSRLGNQFSSALITAFDGLAIKGKSLGDVFKSLALSLSNMVLKAALKPLTQGLGSMFEGMFAGAMPFAKGAAFQQGTPVPFAQGGVIASPIAFPLTGGRTGIAGERGAEAIMPLARGADGRLGVVAQGGGGGPSITINIATSDVDSFRRSEGQVAAMITRAAALGNRNL